jgi:DNA-binding transcriptional MerR regulator
MEQELISKKELLALTGISYGQLYRWKRERLLPEDWFIKRSSFTGQETFFPRTQILERIAAIKELKDRYSLDAIADFLSPQSGDAVAVDALKKLFETDGLFLDAVVKEFGENTDSTARSACLSFSEAVFVGALGSLVDEGSITSSVAAQLAFSSRTLATQWASETMHCKVLVVKDTKDTNAILSWHLALFKEGAVPVFSDQLQILAELPLEATSAHIKRQLLAHKNTDQETREELA